MDYSQKRENLNLFCRKLMTIHSNGEKKFQVYQNWRVGEGEDFDFVGIREGMDLDGVVEVVDRASEG